MYQYKKYPIFSFRDHYSFKYFALELVTYIWLDFSLSLWSSFIVVFLAVVQVVLTKMSYIPGQIHYVTLF